MSQCISTRPEVRTFGQSTPGRPQSISWKYRLAAGLIDIVVVALLQFSLLLIALLFGAGKTTVFVLIVQLVPIVYYSMCCTSTAQSTVGQRQFGLYVTGRDGRRLGLRQGFEQNLWRVIASPISICFVLGLIVKAMDIWCVMGISLFLLSLLDAAVVQVRAGIPDEWEQSTEPSLSKIKIVECGVSYDTVAIETERGCVESRHYTGRDTRFAVVVVGGCGGGFGTPGEFLYHHLGLALQERSVTMMWLKFRKPRDLHETIHDVRAAVDCLESVGFEKIAVVGHSAGGAAVISAAAMEPAVTSVVTLASQNAGADLVGKIAPRPFVIIHGKHDRILPGSCAIDLFNRALEPKTLKFFDGGHKLASSATELFHYVYDQLCSHFFGDAVEAEG